jgi:hypothetical protein
MTSNTSEKVTPINKEDVVPPVADRIASRAKSNLKNATKNPNVKWALNTARGVLIKGIAVTVTQGITGTVESTISSRVPKA